MRHNVLMLSFFLSLVLMVGCTKDVQSISSTQGDRGLEDASKTNDELNSKEKEIEKLNRQIEKLENEMTTIHKGQEIFPSISNLSMDFVRAHTTGDINAMIGLVSEEIQLEERGNEIFASSEDGEYLLFSEDSKEKLEDWVIQGYGIQ